MAKTTTAPATMKAVRYHEYGGPDQLRLEDTTKPTPGPGEVLIEVYAASVNPIDVKVRAGLLKEMMPLPLPRSPGMDVSGIIAALGMGVTSHLIGDEVFGVSDLMHDGTFAEFAVVKAENLARRPRFLDHTRAAAVPLAALTAWQAMFGDRYEPSLRVKAGQTILIRGAGGGVGHFATQFAKWKGARTAVVVMPDQVKFAREMGADVVIEHGRLRAKDVLRGADSVLDLIGGDLGEYWDVLKAGSSLASTVVPLKQADGMKFGMHAIGVQMKPNAEHLAEIGKLIDERTIKVVIAEVVPLAEARRAHELVEGGKVRGKVVVQVKADK